MDFNPNTNYPITALATPKGFGAIAIIRVSGYNLVPLIKKLTNGTSLSHRKATYVSLFSPESAKLLDKCLLTFFHAPNSYTGEDVLEISCHGGDYIPQTILEALYRAGINAAKPGEFSYRAFLNNKIDLIQAESVASLIASKSRYSADVSLTNLTGYFSETIKNIRLRLLNLLTILEKELDFSEDEILFTSKEDIIIELVALKKSLSEILNTAHFGKIITSGVRIVLLGKPNVGKSSLFNHLLGNNRSIVSDIPGTTRDTIESWTEINGYHVCLVDTAGCWESEDYLESLGIEKTISELGNADLILFIDDKDPVVEFSSFKFLDLSDRIIFVNSKVDQYNNIKNSSLGTSIKTGAGINSLINEIESRLNTLFNKNSIDAPVIVSTRQKTLIEKADLLSGFCIKMVEENIEPDFIMSQLRDVLTNLENIIGVIPNEDIIENIFSNFCIGK